MLCFFRNTQTQFPGNAALWSNHYTNPSCTALLMLTLIDRRYFTNHHEANPVSPTQAAVKTALKMNDPHFAMSIYEEAGDVFFKGHRSCMASLPFFRVRRRWTVVYASCCRPLVMHTWSQYSDGNMEPPLLNGVFQPSELHFPVS